MNPKGLMFTGLCGLGCLALWVQFGADTSPDQNTSPRPKVQSRKQIASKRGVAGQSEVTASGPAAKRQDVASEIGTALRSGQSSDKELALTKLLPELIANDAAQAARLVETLEPWAWREDALHLVARSWASVDSSLAAAWAFQLADETERNTALADVALQLAESKPKAALELAVTYDIVENGRIVQLNLTQLWAAQEAEAATEWVRSQNDPEFQAQAYARVALAWAETNPAEAAKLVVERIPRGEVQSEAAMSVLHQWLLRDPAAAESWVELFPEGDFRQRAEDELAGFQAYQIATPPPGKEP